MTSGFDLGKLLFKSLKIVNEVYLQSCFVLNARAVVWSHHVYLQSFIGNFSSFDSLQ